VLHLAFRHPDSALLQPVLREVINSYLKLHVEKFRGDRAPEVGGVSNISLVRAPSSPVFDFAAVGPLAMIAAAGVLAGLVWTLVASWHSTRDVRHHRGIG
jgi:hypothetical protein